MEKDNKLVYIDEKGNEVLCEILFTFEAEEFKKNYVLFYPVGADEKDDEEVEVLAASFVPAEDGSVGELFDVETDEEWQLIEETLESFVANEDEECDECDDECEDGCCSGDCV